MSDRSLPSKAGVVIIGGGVIGCSIAYHLSKLNWTDVVLLERKQLTSGTTWHAAGLVGQLRTTINMTTFQDMRVTDNPYEIGMGRLVDLDMEAEFIGKDALKKINQDGIKKRIVGIEILGDPITKIVPDE